MIHSSSEVLHAIEIFRKIKGHVSNIYLSTAQLINLLAGPDVYISLDERLLVIAARDEYIVRVYFTARRIEDLAELSARLPQTEVPSVVDIVGREPVVDHTAAYLVQHGFCKQSTYIRMSAQPFQLDRPTVGRQARVANLGDLDQIVSLIKGEFNYLEAHIPRENELAGAINRGEILAIDGPDGIKGAAYFQELGPKHFILRYFVVRLEDRGRGIGYQLLSHFQESHDFDTITSLWVSLRNPALNLYKKINFVPSGLKDHILVTKGLGDHGK